MCQRLVVEVASDLRLTEVAVYRHEMYVVVIARLHVQLFQLVVGGRRQHVEVGEVKLSNGVIDVVSVEVGCQFTKEACIAPLVANVRGFWREIQQRGGDVHQVASAFGFDLSCNIQSQVGVVDGQSSGNVVLAVCAVQIDVFILVALIVYLVDDTLGCYRWPLLSQLSVNIYVCCKAAELIVVQQSFQVQVACRYVA